jgi:hypothetical protein
MAAGDVAEADDQSILCWGDYRQGVLGNDSTRAVAPTTMAKS